MTFDDFAGARLPAVLRFATALTGDRDLAKDLVQEVHGITAGWGVGGPPCRGSGWWCARPRGVGVSPRGLAPLRG